MPSELKIAGIARESIVDGPGIRLVVFAQGCRHNCPGCHNPATHSFEGGTAMSMESILEALRANPLLDGITLSGGEPFEQAEGFAELAFQSGLLGLHVMTYTGYTYEQILAGSVTRPAWSSLLAHTDILVDGPFELEKRNLLLKFRGSENQRLIDVKKTRAFGKIVIIDDIE